VIDSVGIGVLGGNSVVATRAVMPAIDRSPHAHLAAAASLSAPLPDPWTTIGSGTYDDVIDHPAVEAVYIALPNGMHAEWTERAVAAGKHVLCEKPVAMTPDEAASMAAAADAGGVLLAEAWMTPFDARWRAAMNVAADGELGEVVDIDASFTFTITDDHNYRWQPGQGGGALLDVGIYCLGPVVELWGTEPDLVAATALWDRRGVDARTEATLEWIDGRQARIRCSFVDPEEQRLEIVGEQASLVIDGDAHTGGMRASTFTVAGDRVESRSVEPSDPYQGMVDAFALAVRDSQPWPRPMTDSIELLRLIRRIEDARR
jgi:predicted dehydrogenase